MKLVSCALACAVSTWAEHAASHGFGARYDLPVPLAAYLTTAGLVVALSFAIAAPLLHVRRVKRIERGLTFGLSNGVLAAGRTVGVLLYLLVVVAGLFGMQSPFKNIAPLLVWAVWWVGMSYVSAFIGNVWLLLNPLDALFVW